MQNQKWLILLLLVFVFFLFFYKVGDRDLWAPDETEYAEVSREMVEFNHWIFPTVNNKPYAIKPVLYNWLMASVSLPFADVNEFRARIISSLAALATVLVIFYLGTIMFSMRAGFLASFVLATNLLFLQFARWVQINMLSTLFFTITLFLFYRGYTAPEKRSRSYLLMYITIGLGMLNMGPVDVIMPALVIGLYLLFMKDLKHLRELKLGWGILIFLTITIPWYLAVSLKGEYAFDILIRTNFIRYFDTWTHERPFYYYLVNISVDFFPWSVFLPGAFYLAFSARSKGDRKKLSFLLIWAISLFFFFSSSECKRPQYILPLYPALSLLVAYLADRAIQSWNDRFFQKWTIIPSFVLLSLLCLGAIGVPVYAWIYQKIWFSTALWTGILFGLFGGLIFIALKRKNPVFIFCLPVLFMLAFTLYGVHFVIPKIEVYKSPRIFCQNIKDQLEHGGQWAMYKFFRSAYVYYTHSFCTVLKTEEELKKFLDQKSPSLVVIREQDYQRIKDSLLKNTPVLFSDQIGHRSMLLISNQNLN